MEESLAWSGQTLSFVLASPILPVRHQTSIVGRNELNFRVRDGNGWTLALINTNFILTRRLPSQLKSLLNCNRFVALCQYFSCSARKMW